jgi:ABC-2 type transport system ATP-binding protein
MIEIKDLQKVIEGRTVIDLPEITVKDGEISALVGRAGSEKSTLLSLLIGEMTPSMGGIRFDGVDMSEDRLGFSRRVGVLFAEDGLYQQRTVKGNLAFYCSLYGLPRERVRDVMARVGLSDHGDVRADKLPSGLARRLAFGRAISHEPKTLLLYEPFDRCDEISISLLSDLIRDLADGGVATLILANDNAYLTGLCESIYELDGGRIVDSYHPKDERRAELPFKVPVRLEGRVALVNPVDILFADVEEGRAYLTTNEGRLPTQFTLSELESRLVRSGFFRAHRAYLVNLQHVKEVIPYTRNSFSLRLNDPQNTEIPLSKSAAGELKSLLDY